MSTIIDYLSENKDKTFTQLPLNDSDILCINEIGYFSYEKIILNGNDLLQEIELMQVLHEYEDNKKDIEFDFLVTKARVELLSLMATSERFKNLRLSHYVNEIDEEFEKQFAAMLFRLPQINHNQMVFRGTDDSVIGWKEDFQLTYVHEIPAHRSAISYLKDYLGQNEESIIVSGHSKGGNLALYAVTNLGEELQKRVSTVYLYDSPGLHESDLKSDAYQLIREKLRVIRPEESIVGVMLYWDVTPLIVGSHYFGILQHAAVNWQVDVITGSFQLVEKATDLSLNLEKTFKQWNNDLSSQELKLLADTLFDTLMASGVTSLNDLNSGSQLAAIISSFRSIDSSKITILIKSAKLFILAFAEHSQLANLEIPKIPLPEISLPDFRELKEKTKKK